MVPSRAGVVSAVVLLLACLLALWSTSPIVAFSTGTAVVAVAVIRAWMLPQVTGRVLLYLGSAGWLLAIAHHDNQLLGGIAATLIVWVVLGGETLSWLKRHSEHVSSLDPLTGATNRRSITDLCQRHLDRVADRGTPFSVIALDLDGLRELNNERGHYAGDQLLVEAVRHWQARLRPNDRLGRVGGDEFVVLLPGVSALEAAAIAERLHVDTTVSWSAGVAQARVDDTVETLMHRADERMYREKARHHQDRARRDTGRTPSSPRSTDR